MRHAIIPFLIASVVVHNSARAQGPEDEAQAEVLFSLGVRLIDDGRTSDACERFEASMRLSPTSGTALALGNCFEMLGRTASAFGTFAEASRLAEGENRARNLEAARKRKEALAPRLRTLAIKLAGDLRLASPSIRLDDQQLDLDAASHDRPIDPGLHVVEATADGYEPFRKRIEIGDSSVILTISMEKVPPPPPPPSPPPEVKPAAPAPMPVPAPPEPEPEPTRTLSVHLAESASGSATFSLETPDGDQECPSAVTAETPCRLRNLRSDEAVIHVAYKGAKLRKVIDLRPGYSKLDIETGSNPNSALLTIGVLGLLGGVGSGTAALVTSTSYNKNSLDDDEKLEKAKEVKRFATIAAVSGGAGLLTILLGYAASSPYIKVVGPRAEGRVARAPRVQPLVGVNVPGIAAASSAPKLYVGMNVTF